MQLFLFLIQVFIISFSGAMAPGPVTATAISLGSRNRYAGALMAIGHGIIEFPLMVLIMLGMAEVFKSIPIQIAIGALGGILLLIMAIQMFTALKNNPDSETKPLDNKPILAGIVLSASNPYFILWWATIGLKLSTDAKEFGMIAFPLFAIVHWSCDCTWFQTLSWASFKGSSLLGRQSQKIILGVCSAAMFLFGLKFIFDAIWLLIKLNHR